MGIMSYYKEQKMPFLALVVLVIIGFLVGLVGAFIPFIGWFLSGLVNFGLGLLGTLVLLWAGYRLRHAELKHTAISAAIIVYTIAILRIILRIILIVVNMVTGVAISAISSGGMASAVGAKAAVGAAAGALGIALLIGGILIVDGIIGIITYLVGWGIGRVLKK